MIILADGLDLTVEQPGRDPDNALIAWRNLVERANIVATSEEADYPATNLANPSTFQEWRAAINLDSPPNSPPYTTERIEFSFDDGVEIDYLAIAKHNLGSSAIPISIEGSVGTTADSPPVDIWTEIVQVETLPDDGATIFRFERAAYTKVAIVLHQSDAPARIAVAYVGPILVMERAIYQEHSPLELARRSSVVTGKSESGNFMGRIVLNEYLESDAEFSLLDPTWYRANMAAFVVASKEYPFFFAWRPDSYPAEVGYGWTRNDPIPVNESGHGLIAIEIQMGGIA